jgi:hypothetical protein
MLVEEILDLWDGHCMLMSLGRESVNPHTHNIGKGHFELTSLSLSH